MIMEFHDFVSTESWWNKESNETRIKWVGVKIKETSLFKNQQIFESNLGKNKEQNDYQSKINNLNPI